MDLPLIAEPTFYLIAIPAVLVMGLSKSGFLSGFGSLATPLLALAVPVPQAAAIMLPLLLVMDATGLQQLWRERDRVLLRLLLPAGLLGTVIGAVLFGVLSAKTVAGVVGALTLLFLAQRLVFPPRADAAVKPDATASSLPAQRGAGCRSRRWGCGWACGWRGASHRTGSTRSPTRECSAPASSCCGTGSPEGNACCRELVASAHSAQDRRHVPCLLRAAS